MIRLKISGSRQAVTLIFNMMFTNPLRKFLKVSVLIKRINCSTTEHLKVSFSRMLSSIHCHLLILFGQRSHLPKNIYNFTIRYFNNSLPTRKNIARWGLSLSPDCSFCLNPESLLHIVAGCQQYLDRFT